MAQTVAKKVLVVGGTGFLGMSICKHATRLGWDTVSLSRRGEPAMFQKGHKPDWADKVQWAKGDSLTESTYEGLLDGVTSVVHTVGMILESDYKKVVGASNLCDAVTGVSEMVLGDRGNPFKPRPTYEQVNRDTAINLANAAAKTPSVESFVYISASDIFPLISPRYISSKRQAEQYLFSKPEFRTVVLRPGFMYNEDRPVSMPLAAALQVANMVTKPVAKELATLPLGTSITTPPLHIDTVAGAVVSALGQDGLKGIFDVEGIQHLARQ